MTFRLLFHPVDRHGRTQVSGSSRIGSGPSARSRSRMSARQARLSVSQARLASRQPFTPPSLTGHSAISAR